MRERKSAWLARHVLQCVAMVCLVGCSVDADDKGETSPAVSTSPLTLAAGAGAVGGGGGGGGNGGGCTTDFECAVSGKLYCINGTCVQCIDDFDCLLFGGGTCVNSYCKQ